MQELIHILLRQLLPCSFHSHKIELTYWLNETQDRFRSCSFDNLAHHLQMRSREIGSCKLPTVHNIPVKDKRFGFNTLQIIQYLWRFTPISAKVQIGNYRCFHFAPGDVFYFLHQNSVMISDARLIMQQ
ncbi:hypothetical protein DFO77_101160 [Marinilabilia salmonicolor]|uniref:Uncharacterized protein n=1 Tax=Marinilabilia salmonicolor TaxID=989 RepID=A0A368VGG5_9BACT|nr:hypothetical protein DFO77_101160 [Marinilabilia salmonicolor]